MKQIKSKQPTKQKNKKTKKTSRLQKNKKKYDSKTTWFSIIYIYSE